MTSVNQLIDDPQLAWQMPLQQLAQLIQQADQRYYLSTAGPLMDDRTYDTIRHIYQQRAGQPLPLYPVLKEAPTMPVALSSIRKIKNTRKAVKNVDQQMADWLQTVGQKMAFHQVVISDKLDGASALYYQPLDSSQTHLYTREGRDITHLIPYLDLPCLPPNVAVRGELVMPRTIFQQHYSKNFANARNLVSGQINSKPQSIDRAIIQHIDFVAYELIDLDRPGNQMRPCCQFINLQKLGFIVPYYQVADIQCLTEDYLRSILVQRRQDSLYEIDGLVLVADAPIDRAWTDPQGYPRYAIAYKQDIEGVPVTIARIEWTATKTGKLAPVAVFPEVEIQGSKVSRATAYHGQFVRENKLGPGAQVLINKGGDVIPQIVEVLKPAPQAQMPEQSYHQPDNCPFIYTTQDTPQQAQQQMLYFLKTLGVKHIGPSLIDKLYQAGVRSVIDLIQLQPQHFQGLAGVKDKIMQRALDQLAAGLQQATLAQIIAGSGLLGEGVGVRRLKLIIDHFQGLPATVNAQDLQAIHGIGPKMACQLASNWHRLAPLLDLPIVKAKMHIKAPAGRKAKASNLPDKIVFTGFRDASLKQTLEQMGLQVTNNVSKSTGLVVVKDATTSNKKVEKAGQLGIPIWTVQQLKEHLTV